MFRNKKNKLKKHFLKKLTNNPEAIDRGQMSRC